MSTSSQSAAARSSAVAGNNSLPDVVALHEPSPALALSWVGMDALESWVNVSGLRLPAKIDAHVDLNDPIAKGIHMSRLYLLVDRFAEHGELEASQLEALLDDIVESQEGLSESARLRFRFDLPLRRPALISALSGWRHYPIELEARREAGETRFLLNLEILYSSTCPYSATLSRHLLADHLAARFAGRKDISVEEISDCVEHESGSFATPHAQRSVAEVSLMFTADNDTFEIADYVDRIEQALGTPVQTAVKRADEQEFARLNGHKPMFCEDAARHVAATLEQDTALIDFHVRVEHQESLHAHDAVAEVSKAQ